MNDAIDEYVDSLGHQVEASLKANFKAKWDGLSEEAKDAARVATKDLIGLQLRLTRGDDVSHEIVFAKAALLNVASLVADMTEEAVKDTLIEAAGFLGVALAAFAKGALKGALGV